MTVLSDYVARMVAAGVDQEEAFQMVAEIFAAGAANAAARSPNAKRQHRYRERKKALQTVTKRNASDDPETVTKRNDVTESNAPSLSIDINKEEKKRERRATQMPDGWRPSPDHWSDAVKRLGAEDRAEKELRKFANNARAKGVTYKIWDAAWDNWVDRAIDWSPVKQPPPSSSETDWRAVLTAYKRTGHWSKFAGADPTSPACRAPPEILREFGFGRDAA